MTKLPLPFIPICKVVKSNQISENPIVGDDAVSREVVLEPFDLMTNICS